MNMAAMLTQKPNRQSARRSRSHDTRPSVLSTATILVGALYCVLPVLWLLTASTKDRSELFSTFTFAPSSHLFSNIATLSAFQDGVFWHWMLNSAIYAGGGALASTYISALAGHVLAKFEFPGKSAVFSVLLAGVLVPGVILAVPQYLLLAKVGLAGTLWSVLLPQIINPYGIYLARIYTASSVPVDVVEAARIEGAGEMRIFSRVVLPMMAPGLVTIFLFQFVGIWNNFMLPFLMLQDPNLFPVTVGLSALLNQGTSQPALYTIVITGALLSVLPLIALFLLLQRFWRVDLAAGAVKS
jgi:multiple sugar transport system permease protein